MLIIETMLRAQELHESVCETKQKIEDQETLAD